MFRIQLKKAFLEHDDLMIVLVAKEALIVIIMHHIKPKVHQHQKGQTFTT